MNDRDRMTRSRKQNPERMSTLEQTLDLATAMRAAAEVKGLTAAKVAFLLTQRLDRQIDKDKVIGYFRGDYAPSIPTLWAFCDVVGKDSKNARMRMFWLAAKAELTPTA